MILLIYIMLLSFITLIISSILYLVYIDWINKRFNTSVNKIYQSFAKEVAEDIAMIAEGLPKSEKRIKYVKHKLGHDAYERVFQNVIIKLCEEDEFKNYTKAYLLHFEDYIFSKIKKIKSNGNVKHVQNVFMMGEYRIDHPKIIDYLLKGVTSKSIAARFNSMSALSKIGNAKALVTAIVIASAERGYLNQKVLTDVLDNFEGDKETLIVELLINIDIIRGDFRTLVINYFNNQQNEAPAPKLYELLERSIDKEEQLSILKYFGVICYPECSKKILELLKDDQWEIRAIAARSLKLYTVHFELSEVISALSDENWYVRTNMARSVLQHIHDHRENVEEEVDYLINSLEDRYAIGALEYARHLEENPNEFKETVQKIQKKEISYA